MSVAAPDPVSETVCNVKPHLVQVKLLLIKRQLSLNPMSTSQSPFGVYSNTVSSCVDFALQSILVGLLHHS